MGVPFFYGGEMITYKSWIWDALLALLKRWKADRKLYKVYEGRFKKRLDSLYLKATTRLRLMNSDIELINNTFKIINEKDVSNEDIKAMDLVGMKSIKCESAKEAEIAIEKAKKELYIKEREIKIEQDIQKAKDQLAKAKEAHKEYLDEQAKTKREQIEAEKRLKELEQEKKNIKAKDDLVA